MRVSLAVALGVIACAACALSEPEAAHAEASSTFPRTAAPPRSAAPAAPAASTAPPVANTAPEPKARAVDPREAAPARPRDPSPAGAAACPAGMKLVEGDYCTEVDQKCLKSWFDESNKKLVCEEFQPPATCTGERVHKRFCIDEYPWPGKRGVRPEVMNNFYQAQVKCASVDKRMCTESEWTLSCEGPEMKPFPYGYARDPEKCNGDRPWDGPNMVKVAKRDPDELARLWQGVPNGAQPDCVSDYGIADLAGNTDDVVASETMTSDWKGKYDSVHTGGPWYKGTRNQCRPKIYTHDEGFYYYFLGFRCCAGADGVASDPRTPKQIKAKTPFRTIESLARFTTAQMKQKLEAKQRGECTCKPGDVLCKTMCGTLLGPGARDVVLHPGQSRLQEPAPRATIPHR